MMFLTRPFSDSFRCASRGFRSATVVTSPTRSQPTTAAKMLPRLVLCDPVAYKDECKAMFEGVAEVLQLDQPANRDDFIRSLHPGGQLEGAIGLFERNQSIGRIGRFDEELISRLPPTIKWIAHLGAGYDKVDVVACKERGIGVSNTPGAVDDATATTALYLLISALRGFSAAERSLRAGNWKTSHSAAAAHDLTRRTVAILGLGGIGLRFAELVHAFPMRVLYHNRRKVTTAPEWCEYYDKEHFDDMLAQADVLSVHVPFTEETRNIVDDRMIRKLKKGAVIINTARGQVIEEEAMMQALKDGHLSAVGLDVFYNEPNIDPRWYDIPNAVLLPHVGTATADSVKKMELRALGNLRDFVLVGKGTDLVPELR
ncbi:D-isomer specific 2-hydroxyacid dehydrogenase [Fomitopsis serialis]|uniref:D-isomer specific 2-hydroxyacid dehydrogenase n=1 Tax=Fomitopsis serialis TaxID=139415 RepID=UPI002008DC4B|nr:D-isomer specific 2-hydroxyacid dehydrogenase [Neoantrodia serialis]KAH9917532.1 D-isomer specific 2-hydroxyacid dehydrogenase [Neoantrodia serialis]